MLCIIVGGILTSQASFSKPLAHPGLKSHDRTPSNDFIMSDTSLALIGELTLTTSHSNRKASISSANEKLTSAKHDKITQGSDIGNQNTPSANGKIAQSLPSTEKRETGTRHNSGQTTSHGLHKQSHETSGECTII